MAATKNTTSAPAPEVDQEALDAAIAQGEAELNAELDAAHEAEIEGTDDSPEGDPEPEVELSPVQLRNKLRAELVAAIHEAGVLGLSVLENRDKQQTLHAEAVALRDAGKAARDAHKVARDKVAAIRAQLKD